ncbi:MAG: ATP-dependent helicase HrpB [Planctomycetota bacterium]|nr:MAG: ATP-dependent helicase HrpB [Planctomycetota bacterium]
MPRAPRSPPPDALPVDTLLPEIVAQLRERRALVLRAETGAGKTTRVPPALLDAGLAGEDQVLVLQPRRVAARASASRVALERGGRLGEEVGYAVRLERKQSARTRLLYVTEGLFLRRLLDDPELRGVGAVVFDEFHERHLDTDLAFALLRRVREELRPDLPLLVMSATLPIGPVAEALDAPSVESSGRHFPVDISYLERRESSPLEERVLRGVRALPPGDSGDVLVFLPGRFEIERCLASLRAAGVDEHRELLPLHGELNARDQDAALQPGARPRVILATNVAETSLTLPGVRTVIDSGEAREPRFDPGVGLDRLERVAISRASADQRAGRAGRVGPGRCLRLWTAAEHADRAAQTLPELQRCDLSGALLQLVDWGEADARALPWLEPPPESSLGRAEQELAELGALQRGRLTALGRQLAKLPLAPRLGALLVAGREHGVLHSAALAAALLSERDPLPAAQRQRARHGDCDVWERVEFVRRGRSATAHRVRQLAARLTSRLGDTTDKDSSSQPQRDLRRALLAAFLDRVARRRAPGDERAVLVGGRGLRLDKHSVVREAELFVAVDLSAGSGRQRGEARARLASAIEREWLPAEELQQVDERVFEADSGRVSSLRGLRFRDLLLEETRSGAPRDAASARLLAEALHDDPLAALDLSHASTQALLRRVAFLREHRPELDWPRYDADWWRARLPALCAGKRSVAELRAEPLTDRLRAELNHLQRQSLRDEAPERFTLPSGRSAALRYEDGRPAVLAVRIQELFGVPETPRLAGGRAPVLLELLAPNGRVQQVTDDLAGFWDRTYALVRKDLRGRYPKHAWPQDPLTASPPRPRSGPPPGRTRRR